MKRIYFISNKCLHFLLAIQILNMSFGNLAKEGHFFSSPGRENNQIDSAIEFITENLLGWTDYVPEKGKAHQDNHFTKVNTCHLFCERIETAAVPPVFRPLRLHKAFIPASLADYIREINPPPPKPVSFS